MYRLNCFVLFVLIPLLFSSCVTTRNIQIETLQPARLTIDGARNNIAVVTSQTLLDESVNASEGLAVNVPTDSLIRNILFSFQYFLETMPGYENATFTAFTTTTEELADYSDFDLLAQLDRLQINNAYYGQQYSFYEWEAFLYVHYAANWTLRNNSGAIIDDYTDRDLLIWRSGIQPGKAEAVNNLPAMKDAWWDTGIALAQRHALRIAPNWQKSSRTIYMINKFPELSQLAYRAMQNDAYMRAIDMWESMLMLCRKNGQKNMKSQIYYNLAVAFEFQNQLEQALHWAQRSANQKSRTKTTNYINYLKERQRNQILLDGQLNN